jgi:hypothetical protein
MESARRFYKVTAGAGNVQLPLPVGSDTGAVPFCASSIIAPASAALGPETVPLPSTSPGRRLQPLIVWCATICETVQY